MCSGLPQCLLCKNMVQVLYRVSGHVWLLDWSAFLPSIWAGLGFDCKSCPQQCPCLNVESLQSGEDPRRLPYYLLFTATNWNCWILFKQNMTNTQEVCSGILNYCFRVLQNKWCVLSQCNRICGDQLNNVTNLSALDACDIRVDGCMAVSLGFKVICFWCR